MIYSASYAAHAKSIDLRQANFENDLSPRSRRVGQINKHVLLVMKLVAILLLVACLQVSARGFGQGTVTISVKNVLVTEVFKEIEKQTSFRFLYRDELVKKAGVISVEMKDATVEAVLNRCFDKKPLEYKIFKETIVISEKGASVNSGGGTGIIEEPLPLINVTGRVLNEQGKPVEGVTVTIKGTDKSTFTNSNGEFFLNSVEQDAVLVFSSVNMETFELKVSGKTELVVNLKAKVSELGDVEVIYTGYQDLPKERATGSFVRIDNKLLNRRVSTDILSRIDGVANGVLFNGSSSIALDNVSIRGRSTINANTRPLVIVDNFPYSGDIGLINPNDIESITVLKDAAAASIWGAFSGNGVIVITTKKGKYNQPLKIEINSNVTVGGKPDLFYDHQFLNSTNFLEVEQFLFGNGFYDDDLNNTVSFPTISPGVEILEQLRSGAISQAQADALIGELKNNDIREQYSRYFYRRSINQQYSVNLSGGSAKTRYYISGGYDNNQSGIVNNRSERMSFNSLLTFNPIKKLEITAGIVYTKGKAFDNGMSSISAGGKYSSIYPYAKLLDQFGNPAVVVKDYRGSFAQNPGVTGLLDWSYVPLKELEMADNGNNASDNRLVAGLKYVVNSALNLEVKFQHQASITDQRNYYSPETYFVRDIINKYSIISGPDVIGHNIPLGGILINLISEHQSNAGRGQLNFSKRWNKHAVNAIAGIDVREVKTGGHYNRFYGYDESTATAISVDYSTFFDLFPSGLGSERIPEGDGIVPRKLLRFRSYFANASYSYQDRYTLSSSVRLDQANLFGVKTNQKGAPLWSVGAKWDIDKENFYSIKWLPLLSLRVTYGFNGNIDNTIAAITTASYSTGNAINGAPYARIIIPGNPDLRWEKDGMVNVGIDFALNKQRISGSLEYYHKKGVDMIGRTTIPSSTGVTFIKGNFSDMKSDGIDIVLNSININSKFRWETNLLFSYVKDQIVRNEGDENKRVGNPVNSIFAYRWGGLDDAGDPLGYLDGNLSTDYNAIIDAANEDRNLLSFQGSSLPNVWGAFRNTFSYGKLSMSVNITFKAKYYFKRTAIDYANLFNNGAGHSDYLRRWQKPGDELTTEVPKLVYTDYPQFTSRNLFYLSSAALIEKGDHIRLQDINISYDFGNANSKSVFKNLRAYFYANNLGVLWRANELKIDPDFQTGYPTPKTFALGISANF